MFILLLCFAEGFWVYLDLRYVLMILLLELDVGMGYQLHAHLFLGVGERGHVYLDIFHG